MKKSLLVAVAILAAILIVFIMQKTRFKPAARPVIRRKCDKDGCGQFGASRANGTRKHQGQDFLVNPDQIIYAPISGKVRLLKPYKEDPRFNGVEISGGFYSVKVFYFTPIVKNGETVSAGQVIGLAENLKIKYPGIANHIHVEVRKGGVLMDPSPYFPADGLIA